MDNDDTNHSPQIGFSRRKLLRGAGASLAMGGAVAATGLNPFGTPAAHAAPGGFPDYAYSGIAFDKDSLRYNPNDEFIFPCIRGVYDRLSNPLGRYYLYYAPHDEPGGICLAYADAIAGPYTEYTGNPIVSRSWGSHYSVSHVSSPHVLWNSQAREMWLYFHGENNTTRLARSTNGIDFTYDRVVLNSSMLPAGTTETSYARVFEYPIPSRGSRYVMVFMVNDASNRRGIGWGWSADGRSWQFAQQPLIRPQDLGVRDLSSPHVLERAGRTFVVYHTDEGLIRITEVGQDFSRRDHLGVFHRPLAGFPDNGRSAAPSFGTDRGVSYMVYEAGHRLNGNIAIARERD
ncbi:glycoside hydrolase family protein [Actinoalloteichus hymeniacidonis]|uniref:Secreted protein n=1 Tax=Actinoalloteichus hymeniacidonis TaxID=340345 RepID=A0AAC9MZ70_9PSEU|nr:hypothetical protein [Actinoalloteichus hymeniacidonis]AOS63752.1 hypothetical protein TL08_14715 [Actinoalloteichus hymeniacidonis]MBB5908194.1 hypothetical protein [Actinoalloteichus hymeniacidonis]